MDICANELMLPAVLSTAAVNTFTAESAPRKAAFELGGRFTPCENKDGVQAQ